MYVYILYICIYVYITLPPSTLSTVRAHHHSTLLRTTDVQYVEDRKNMYVCICMYVCIL